MNNGSQSAMGQKAEGGEDEKTLQKTKRRRVPDRLSQTTSGKKKDGRFNTTKKREKKRGEKKDSGQESK